MHLVVIAWLYVTLMMAIAEATNTNGTVLGAVITFVLYGLLPVALVVYLMLTPARRRAVRERELAAQEAARAAARTAARNDSANAATAADGTASAAPGTDSGPNGKTRPASALPDLPDPRSETPADAVPPVREKP